MITRFEKYNLNVFFCCCCILSMNESILSTFLATRQIQEVTASYFSNVGKKKNGSVVHKVSRETECLGHQLSERSACYAAEAFNIQNGRKNMTYIPRAIPKAGERRRAFFSP